MLQNIDLFRLAQSMAQHASARQAVVAENIAHANTPGYKAKTIDGFAKAYSATSRDGGLRASREGHLNPQHRHEIRVRENRAAPAAPNGNSVSIEAEMMAAAELRLEHDTALTVYKSALNIMRAGLGRR